MKRFYRKLKGCVWRCARRLTKKYAKKFDCPSGESAEDLAKQISNNDFTQSVETVVEPTAVMTWDDDASVLSFLLDDGVNGQAFLASLAEARMANCAYRPQLCK
jgi:hypothetical protein